MQFDLSFFLAAALGYLLGSIPFGLLFTYAAGLGDVRKIGSGNIGATNVLRTGNRWLALATLLADAAKGAAAVVLAAGLFGLNNAVPAGIGAFLGHLFPVWLGFRGGKGVATYIGVAAVLWPPGALIFCAVWLLVAVVTRYSSLSALVATLAVPLAALVLGQHEAAAVFAVLTALSWLKHGDNIRKLLAGTESRIGQRS